MNTFADDAGRAALVQTRRFLLGGSVFADDEGCAVLLQSRGILLGRSAICNAQEVQSQVTSAN